MKAKLIKTENGYGLEDVEIIAFYSSKRPVHNHYKLSKQNCDELFGIVDVEKLADAHVKEWEWGQTFKDANVNVELLARDNFCMGFNKAMELNKDKLFTEEDMHAMFILGFSSNMNKKLISEDDWSIAKKFIQSLQQPTEIKVEIITEEFESYDENLDIVKKPILDSEGCLILKKI